ncbi:jg918 [Pararge aegeria aegeria]|uniref:Jg918 protein n=1 Tax=Pararge aegeria aegeria TaxID=348720 RepID=A0A8S4R0H0_9NEOP|nr:jg918 [Pararge aegeria aegeria]
MLALELCCPPASPAAKPARRLGHCAAELASRRFVLVSQVQSEKQLVVNYVSREWQRIAGNELVPGSPLRGRTRSLGAAKTLMIPRRKHNASSGSLPAPDDKHASNDYIREYPPAAAPHRGMGQSHSFPA